MPDYEKLKRSIKEVLDKQEHDEIDEYETVMMIWDEVYDYLNPKKEGT